MRIKTLEALAFGPLRDARIDLAPGLSVIWGKNETGKSSWHGAIQLGLCGLRRARGRRSRSEEALVRRYQPWSGAEWRVRLLIELDDGCELEIDQDLADPGSSKVVEAATGRDRSGELIHDGSVDASTLLGLNREIFAQTICVRQAELMKLLDHADDLQEQLQRAATVSGGDQTAEAALERLQKYRSERVGARRRGSVRPLPSAEEAVQRTRDELERARREHRRYLDLLDDLELAKDEEARCEEARRLARRVLALRQRATLEQRVLEVQMLQDRFPAGEPPPGEPLGEQARRIGEALASWQQRPAVEPLADRPSAAELEDELLALPVMPQGDLELSPAVEQAREEYRRACQVLELHQQSVPKAADEDGAASAASGIELRALAEVLERALPSIDPESERTLAELEPAIERSRRAARIAGTVAALGFSAALLLALVGRPGWALAALAAAAAAAPWVLASGSSRRKAEGKRLLVAARLEAQRDHRREVAEERRRAERRLAELALPTDPGALRRLASAIDEAALLRQQFRDWQRRKTELQSESEETAAILRAALVERGTAEASETPQDRLLALVEHYAARCRRNREQAVAAARRPDLEARLALRREQEERNDEARTRRQTLERELLEITAELGVDGADEESLVERLVAKRADLERRKRELDAARGEYERLGGLLAGASLPELEEHLAELERELGQQNRDAQDSDATPGASLRDLEQAAERASAGLEQAQAAARRLEGELKNCSATVTSLAEAEERHNEAQDALRRLESLDGVLESTIAVLEEAKNEAQREIAPRLREAISLHLPRVTAGRYIDLRIDPANLEIKIQERGGEWRSAPDVSHGTAEQVYLLLRLSLARTLVTTGETAPLLLDDVTVQSDSERTRAILDLLHEESASRQVILFSQEEDVLVWARDRLREPRDRVIELPGPETLVSAQTA